MMSVYWSYGHKTTKSRKRSWPTSEAVWLTSCWGKDTFTSTVPLYRLIRPDKAMDGRAFWPYSTNSFEWVRLRLGTRPRPWRHLFSSHVSLVREARFDECMLHYGTLFMATNCGAHVAGRCDCGDVFSRSNTLISVASPTVARVRRAFFLRCLAPDFEPRYTKIVCRLEACV